MKKNPIHTRPPPLWEPDWGQRGEELVSVATTFMDYTYKSPMETRDYHSKNTDYWTSAEVTIGIISVHKCISNHIRFTADTTC